jgi:hypothetical protein
MLFPLPFDVGRPPGNPAVLAAPSPTGFDVSANGAHEVDDKVALYGSRRLRRLGGRYRAVTGSQNAGQSYNEEGQPVEGFHILSL